MRDRDWVVALRLAQARPRTARSPRAAQPRQKLGGCNLPNERSWPATCGRVSGVNPPEIAIRLQQLCNADIFGNMLVFYDDYAVEACEGRQSMRRSNDRSPAGNQRQ